MNVWPRIVCVIPALVCLIAGTACAQVGGVAPAPQGNYAGTASCAPCHPKETALWRGSHHDLAMQEATKATVRGDFNEARFTYAGVESKFFVRKGRYFVNTDGPDGKLRDFEIKYTFGVTPLQQYLIEFPDGRVQALSIAWDTRPRDAGGQRWFHLYANETVDFRDELHWTRPAQNWNHMCAECHSTGLRKNYDAEKDRFATRWSEIDVGCEACHGPASAHLAWAKGDRSGDAGLEGFTAKLNPGAGVWRRDGQAPIASLHGTRNTTVQIDTCGRCHARRSEIAEDAQPGRPLGDSHRVAVLEPHLYHADGQILGEVYEYGSFLQSRMHAVGVACTDCHDAHSGKLVADGNAACATCHSAATFDTVNHHRHEADSDAARCVSCHMPSRLYMEVDRRHDHAFRVPRPDLSVALGTPNACNDCHTTRTPAWSAEAVVKWFGPTRTRGATWSVAFTRGRRHEAGADRALRELAAAPGVPPIVRATALEQRSASTSPLPAGEVEAALRDADPLVRRAAVRLLARVEAQSRWRIGAPLLGDPIRSVRLEAVNALADLAGGMSPGDDQRRTFDRAAQEYRAAQQWNADRAEPLLNLGALEVRLGRVNEAESAYRRAIRLEPWFAPAAVNLADLYRALGREGDAERVLNDAVRQSPDAADAHHSLGLLMIRTGRRNEAVAELGRAARLGPTEVRYAYVHAIALDGIGKRDEAIQALLEAQRRFPADRDILSALAELNAARGDRDAAAYWAQELRGSEP